MKTPEELAEDIREIVEAELVALKGIQGALGLGEEGLKRLAQCSLILYRIRTPLGGSDPEMPSDKVLMKGGPIE